MYYNLERVEFNIKKIIFGERRGNYIEEPDLEESDVVPIPVIVLEVSDTISE